MNKKQKILASISLFLVLFSGAWYANDYNQRTIHSKGYDEIDNMRILQTDDHNIPVTTPFKPREYIRIGNRTIPAK
ncbi:hypothetical protein [Halalkalibacter urbisdiaboli]|uniref:hypothetical protein n=1 Tax=Halalkalibacter urbisdiaboli TaxID=1960589 RepID=UPI000B44E8CE|nr:hypothetical protein [Halalkalibacter urbisdiaboli]